MQSQDGGSGVVVVGGRVVEGGVATAVNVQNALIMLDEQAVGVSESAGVGVAVTDTAIAVSGKVVCTTMSVCRYVVGVGETSGTALVGWEEVIGDGSSSVHG